ncbi:MAG: flavin reductase [Niameybacter sp.]|uniref:flavin reductase n=1 Tax=Niameybacter sp. TaxID=2033640 RepID=UPI002FC6D5B1
MNSFISIQPEALEKNPFQLIGKDWMLVTAEADGKANTMTASWGGLGVMWGKNVAYVVIRPQRYTKTFIDASDRFSLSFYPESFKKELGYLGKVSGRDEDKIAKAGLTLAHAGETPYFEEANLVLVCKKLYAQEFKPECFIEDGLDEKWYPNKDYHVMYVVEVEEVLVKA